MSRVIELLLMGIVITFTNVYIGSKLLQKIPNFKSIKTYIIFVFMIVATLINYFYNNDFVRILTITVLMSIFFKFLFDEKLKYAILSVITSQMIYMISEFIFAIFISIIFHLSANDIVDNQFGSLISNVVIAATCIIFVTIPLTKKLYDFFIKITDKVKNHQLIIFLLITILIANILTMILYYKVNFSSLLLFNMLLTLFCFAIVLYSFKTKNNYVKVYDKYNTTLNSLKEYESMLDRYRISNHENKNQLLTIRNMLPKTNKQAIGYIDTIVENKLKDNDKVMLEVSIIPAGGLRGLIYTKLLLMKESGIIYELEISKDIKTVDLINNIDDSTMLDICKIIGVYIDNAIHAVEGLNEMYINIEMYLDESDLVISVANNYKGIIEIDKLEELGYTTGGVGHGYGLTLTKEIIKNNKRLSNQKSITRETFTQILKIKNVEN